MSSDDIASALEFRRLDGLVNRGGFTCRNEEIDSWFKHDALAAHMEGSIVVTYAHLPGRPERPVGFYALATVAEEVARLPGAPPRHRPRRGDHFSALQLVWLGVDHYYQGKNVGSRLMGRMLQTFAEVGPRIGLPMLIVMPHPEGYDRLKSFYERLFFREYVDGGTMFLPLQLVPSTDYASVVEKRAPD